MDDLLLMLLWLAALSGGLAILALIAELVEWCAEAFDAWQKEVFTNYVDD